MQPQPALTRWLNDPVAQAATEDAMRAFRDAGSGAIGRFEATLAALRVSSGGNAGLEVIGALRSLLTDVRWFDELLGSALAGVRDDPFFEPPLRSLGAGVGGGLMLVDDPLAAVSARIAPAAAVVAGKSVGGRRSIGFTGIPSLLHIRSGAGACFAFYEADHPGCDFTASSAAPCRFVGRRTVADGELIAVDGRTQSFVIEHAPRDLLMLVGEARSAAVPLARQYDAESLELVAVTATDETASRVQLMLSLLRLMGRADAASCFVEAASDGPFYLRWYAMRELLALDPAIALPVLGRMAAADPHPEVRAAAGSTRDVLVQRYPLLFDLPAAA